MSYALASWQAILATVYIADKERRGDTGFVATARVADDLAIPAPSMSRILRSLAAAGIIATKEGAGGGVRLGRPPAAITLLDVIEAIDPGPVFRTDSRPRVTGPVPTRRLEDLRTALGLADGAMRASLEEVTIESIIT